jgi:hypothetical protein
MEMPTPTVIRTAYFKFFKESVRRNRYNDGQSALLADGDVLSVNLMDYNLICPKGHVFIKDYSEHVGLADALEEAGVVKKLERIGFGPFDASAWLCEVSEDVR